MLWELRVAEQRYRAVQEVLDGASVTAVARRFGVSRQSVHAWLGRYAADGGLGGLGDRSSRPHGCPHQMGRWWRPGFSRSGGRIRCGGRIGSAISWSGTGSVRRRAGPVSIGRCCARPGGRGAAASAPGGLPTLGTGSADGVVAARCGRRLPSVRRDRGEGGLGDR